MFPMYMCKVKMTYYNLTIICKMFKLGHKDYNKRRRRGKASGLAQCSKAGARVLVAGPVTLVRSVQ